jgi:hypothetical protein
MEKELQSRIIKILDSYHKGIITSDEALIFIENLLDSIYEEDYENTSRL